jgi:hypothetical protein
MASDYVKIPTLLDPDIYGSKVRFGFGAASYQIMQTLPEIYAFYEQVAMKNNPRKHKSKQTKRFGSTYNTHTFDFY